MVWPLLRIWTGIGLQSFGGGASTQLLIRREFVQKRRLIEADELGRFWNLCLFTPGINLIALTILIGRKLGGIRGIVVSLAGMLLPSAAVTCALAAGFGLVQHSQAVRAILHGVIPATAGIMAVVAIDFALPPFRRAQTEGGGAVGISIALMLIGATTLIVLKLPVFAVLPGVALLGIALFTPRQQSIPAPSTPDSLDEDRP
jgi:chromate transporter